MFQEELERAAAARQANIAKADAEAAARARGAAPPRTKAKTAKLHSEAPAVPAAEAGARAAGVTTMAAAVVPAQNISEAISGLSVAESGVRGSKLETSRVKALPAGAQRGKGGDSEWVLVAHEESNTGKEGGRAADLPVNEVGADAEAATPAFRNRLLFELD